MSHLFVRVRRRRRGLTLMELIVVLTILVGLAAILVPMFPNLLRRTHKATDATQTAEAAKAIQLYQASYISYPDNFDLLHDGTAFPGYMPNGSAAPFGTAGTSIVKLSALSTFGAGDTSGEKVLGRVGITHGMTLDPTSTKPTLDPYGTTGASVTLAPATLVAEIDMTATGGIPVELRNILATDPTAKFVIFGIGQRCTMVGKTIMNAPTSVPQDKGFTPDNKYCRVGAVFLIAGNEVEKTERARFIMCVALEDDELESTEKDVVGYYNVSASP